MEVWGAEDVQSQLDGVVRNKKRLPLPSQTKGTIEHGSRARYTNNYFLLESACAAPRERAIRT